MVCGHRPTRSFKKLSGQPSASQTQHSSTPDMDVHVAEHRGKHCTCTLGAKNVDTVSIFNVGGVKTVILPAFPMSEAQKTMILLAFHKPMYQNTMCFLLFCVSLLHFGTPFSLYISKTMVACERY